jgi:hypothetical protein
MSIPFDIHVCIVKLLPLKDAIAYSEVTPVTKEAVEYVFAHRKQLDFGSVLGPNSQIMLPDRKIFNILHAHIRAEVIMNFSVQATFSSFARLRRYMKAKLILMYSTDGYPLGVGHGILCKIRYSVNTYCGGANQCQGQKLKAIWDKFDDEYGIFCIDYTSFNAIIPMYTAPANWSTVRVHNSRDGSSDSDSDE